MPTPILLQKNILINSSIKAETVHIGDQHYYSIHQEELENTILFLTITKSETQQYTAQLQINGKEQQQAVSQIVALELEDKFFKGLKGFENYKRQGTGAVIGYRSSEEEPFDRDTGKRDRNQQWEASLGFGLYQKCLPKDSAIRLLFEQFLELLKNRRIHNLSLVFSSPESTILNVPFEIMRQEVHQAPLSIIYDNLLICHSQTTQLADFEQGSISEVALPLRLLVVTALPWNADGQLIDLEKEQELIFAAIDTANKQIINALGDLPSNKRIVVEFLEVGSLAEIERALITGKHHILHISGHGFFFDTAGKGFLNLENEEGGLAQVSGEELAKVLEPFKQHLKLVLFSACETARAEKAGIAGALMNIGVPAILAMRYPVLDRTATLFTATFYQHLCKGATLSESLFFARKAIWDIEKETRKQQALNPTLSTNTTNEWFTPFLYLNQYIGRLINPSKPIEEAAYFFQQHRSAFFFKGIKNEKLERSPAKLVAKGFVGRRRQLAQLTKLYRTGQRIVCIHGIGGIGKTSLAARFLDNYQNKGFIILPFVGEVTAHQILLAMAKNVAEEQRIEAVTLVKDQNFSPEEKLNFLINGYYEQASLALFFDNFEDNQGDIEGDNKLAQLKSTSLAPFLTTLCQKIAGLSKDSNIFLLFTTRYKIVASFSEVIHFMDLAIMTFADTYKLINRSKGLVHLSLSKRREIQERLGGHPRAMELLDSYFRTDVHARWEAVTDKFSKVEDFLTKHDLLLDLLWAQLTTIEQQVLSVGAIFKRLTDIQGITTVIDQPNLTISPIVNKLNNLSLIYLEGSRFHVHRLTSQWVLAPIDSTQQEAWHDSAGEYLLFRETDETGNAVIDMEEGLDIRGHFFEAKKWKKAADITVYLVDAYRQIGHFNFCLTLLDPLVSEPLPEEEKMLISNRLGIIYEQKGNYTEAIVQYEASSRLCKKFNHIQGQIGNLRQISEINMIVGDKETAKENLLAACKLAEGHDDLLDELASCLLQIGTIDVQEGNLLEANANYFKALEIATDINAKEIIGHCTHQLGRLNEIIGEYDDALKHYEKAVAIADEMDNPPGMSMSLHHIGTIYLLRSQLEKALHYTTKSLRISEAYQDTRNIAISYSQIGSIYRLMGDYQKALYYNEQAFTSSLQIGNIEGVITGLLNAGILHIKLLENEEALAKLENAYQQATDYQFPTYQGTSLELMGNIFLNIQEDIPKAEDHYTKALHLYEELKDISSQANIFNRLATIAIIKKDFEKANTYIDQAMSIRKKLDQEDGIITCLYNFGTLEEAQGNFEKATDYYSQGIAKSKQLNLYEKGAEGYSSLSILETQRENYKTALELGTTAILLLQHIKSPKTTQAAQNVLELEAHLPSENIYAYLKSKGLDIQYIEGPE